MGLDEECGKYEMVFIDNLQAANLANDYPIYTITICRNCKHRAIGPVVSRKYRTRLIPNECDACIDNKVENLLGNGLNANARTKGRRISSMKKNKGKKVGPHPYPKNAKLTHKQGCIDLSEIKAKK